jgi:hypothetical protein
LKELIEHQCYSETVLKKNERKLYASFRLFAPESQAVLRRELERLAQGDTVAGSWRKLRGG